MKEIEVFINCISNLRKYAEFDPNMVFYEARNLLEKMGEKIYIEELPHITNGYLMDELISLLSDVNHLPEVIIDHFVYIEYKTDTTKNGYEYHCGNVNAAEHVVIKLQILLEWYLDRYYNYKYLIEQ